MESTTPPHDGGNERTTDDGQKLVANGKAKHLAEQSDTTANPFADAPDHSVSGLYDAESAVGIKTTTTDYSQALAAPMPPLPPEVYSALSDSEPTAKEQAMALTNGEEVEGIPAYMARQGGEPLRKWEARVGKRTACMRPETTGKQAAGIEASGKQREQANRDVVAERCTRERTSHVSGSPFLAQLSQDDRQHVIDEATRLADKYEAVNERVAVKIIARYTQVYGILNGGIQKARSQLLRDVPTTLSDIDPQETGKTDAIVEITYLKEYDDRHDGKAVAASVRGDDGDNGHLTVWHNSIKGDYDTIDSLWLSTSWNGDAAEIETTNLNVGDRLLIRDASVSEYYGEPSLALTDDSTLQVIEKGDGPSVGNTAEYNGEHTQNPTRCTGAGATVGGGVTTDDTDNADADGETTTTTNADTTQEQTTLGKYAA